jgi:hypothetical protein
MALSGLSETSARLCAFGGEADVRGVVDVDAGLLTTHSG